MSELKRCPCCNGEDIVTGDKAYSFGTDIYIRCRTCGLKMQICSEFGWEELFKRWNTRKSMERIVERLEEYRDDFMNDVYEELQDDADNCRANRIIYRFDDAIEIVKEEGELNEN